jgi:hypothetical protein
MSDASPMALLTGSCAHPPVLLRWVEVSTEKKYKSETSIYSSVAFTLRKTLGTAGIINSIFYLVCH